MSPRSLNLFQSSSHFFNCLPVVKNLKVKFKDKDNLYFCCAFRRKGCYWNPWGGSRAFSYNTYPLKSERGRIFGTRVLVWCGPSAAPHGESAGLNHSADTCVQRSWELSAWSGFISLWWLSLEMELQGIILPVGASNGWLCYCQQYFCSGWFKRVFPTFKSYLVNACNEALKSGRTCMFCKSKHLLVRLPLELCSGCPHAVPGSKQRPVVWRGSWAGQCLRMLLIEPTCLILVTASLLLQTGVYLKPLNTPWCKNGV